MSNIITFNTLTNSQGFSYKAISQIQNDGKTALDLFDSTLYNFHPGPFSSFFFFSFFTGLVLFGPF